MRKPTKIDCAECPHRRTGIYAAASDEAVSRLDRQRTVQTLRPGQTLFGEGGPPLAVHCLYEGRVKIFMAGEGGEELLLEFCEPGRMLGLRAAIAGEPYKATAVADERSTICTIPREAFEDLLDHAPAAARAAATVLARELGAAHERLMEALQHCVSQRVAHVLVTLHEEATRRTGKERASVRMRRTDLAHMIGTTPETLSRVLHALDARGAVVVGRSELHVRDSQLLRRIAKLPPEGR